MTDSGAQGLTCEAVQRQAWKLPSMPLLRSRKAPPWLAILLRCTADTGRVPCAPAKVLRLPLAAAAAWLAPAAPAEPCQTSKVPMFLPAAMTKRRSSPAHDGGHEQVGCCGMLETALLVENACMLPRLASASQGHQLKAGKPSMRDGMIWGCTTGSRLMGPSARSDTQSRQRWGTLAEGRHVHANSGIADGTGAVQAARLTTRHAHGSVEHQTVRTADTGGSPHAQCAWLSTCGVAAAVHAMNDTTRSRCNGKAVQSI